MVYSKLLAQLMCLHGVFKSVIYAYLITDLIYIRFLN